MATKNFCFYHVATVENPSGDCAAHLAEARVFSCPYENAAEAENKCVDFKVEEGK